MNKNNSKPRTVKLSIIISLTISIATIIIISYFTFTEETIDQLLNTNIKFEFFILALLVTVLYWICWGARLQALTNAVDKKVKVSLKECTKIVLANLFLANITPSMAGGEPVRIYLLNKDGIKFGSATAVVLGERLLDAVFLLVCLPFAFLVFSAYINSTYFMLVLFLAVSVFIVAVVFFGLAIKYPNKVKKILIFFNDKIGRITKKGVQKRKYFINRINREVDNFHESMVFFLTKGKLSFLKSFLFTALFWCIGWIIPILILMGLGLGPHVIESSAAQILLLIVVMMPTTPGSAGVTEGGMIGLYSVFIDNIGLVNVFVILFRLATYYFGFIVGTIFMQRIFKSVASFSLDEVKREIPDK